MVDLSDVPPPRRFRFIAKASLAAVRLIAMGETEQGPANRTGIKTWLSLLRCYSASFPVPSDLSGSLLGTEWAALVRALPPAAPLYWVTADIQDAFGSVKLRKLGRILRNCQEEVKPGDREAAETTSQISLRSMQMTGSLQVGERVTTYYVSQGLLQGDELSSHPSTRRSCSAAVRTTSCSSPQERQHRKWLRFGVTTHLY